APRSSRYILSLHDALPIYPAVPQDRATRGEQRPTKNPLEGNAQAISNGGAMFRTRCAGCHGPDARGYVGPDLTGVWLAGNTDDQDRKSTRLNSSHVAISYA